MLRCDLPPGPSRRRYNHNDHGQRNDGAPFDGPGRAAGGRPDRERWLYELAARRDPRPLIEAMERFANAGGMGKETADFKLSDSTESTVPLCWAHAECMTLVRGAADGGPFDRIAPVYERYGCGSVNCRSTSVRGARPETSLPVGR